MKPQGCENYKEEVLDYTAKYESRKYGIIFNKFETDEENNYANYCIANEDYPNVYSHFTLEFFI